MLNKLGILITILVLVFIFFFSCHIFWSRGIFKKEIKSETKKYLKSVNILLIIITVVGIILVLFFIN